jgi:hypothetical protein
MTETEGNSHFENDNSSLQLVVLFYHIQSSQMAFNIPEATLANVLVDELESKCCTCELE